VTDRAMGVVQRVSPFQGLRHQAYQTRGFTLGYHIAGLQPARVVNPNHTLHSKP